jgi:dTDP-4-amino-4,6-dideoxygalactose transaminase
VTQPLIPVIDLHAQYRGIKTDVEAAVLRVLDSTQWVLGEEVAAFEQEFARFCGAGEAVAVNSGTSALHLSLLSAGVGPGDEVITVPFTFIATIAAIEYAGARPVLVDIEPRTFTMDPAAIERAITPRTKAIVPVHLYGQAADMDPILELARARGIAVIEDAAQAHGAEYKGRRCGSLGDLAAFSFYPTKNLGAYGEGGAVVTSDPAHAERIRTLRNWGQRQRYEHALKGFNCRMDGIQGAILRVKLRRLEQWTEARRARAAEYDRRLAGTEFAPPYVRPGGRHVYHLYTVRVGGKDGQRERCREHLEREGIQTAIHYPIPAHLQPAYADLGYGRGDFPVTEAAAAEVMSLPLFPEMTDGQLDTVAGALQHLSASFSAG